MGTNLAHGLPRFDGRPSAGQQFPEPFAHFFLLAVEKTNLLDPESHSGHTLESLMIGEKNANKLTHSLYKTQNDEK